MNELRPCRADRDLNSEVVGEALKHFDRRRFGARIEQVGVDLERHVNRTRRAFETLDHNEMVLRLRSGNPARVNLEDQPTLLKNDCLVGFEHCLDGMLRANAERFTAKLPKRIRDHRFIHESRSLGASNGSRVSCADAEPAPAGELRRQLDPVGSGACHTLRLFNDSTVTTPTSSP